MGAAIVIVAVAVAVSLSKRSAPGTSAPHTGSPGTSSSSASAALASRQAAAINTLLGSSTAARQTLVGALRKVGNCRHLPKSVSQIQNVVNQRSAEYNHALALSTAAMAKGAIVKSDLIAALRHSLQADRDYLTWAQQQLSSGCTPTAQSSAYQAALSADRQADAAKATFVQVWNSVATRYGVQRKSPGDI